MTYTIGLSNLAGAYADRYIRWLSGVDRDVRVIELLSQHDPVAALAACHGLLLPGGGDPEPALYGVDDPDSLCNVEAERDRQEFSLIRTAIDRRLPILGVCRGLQIMNVALGGTLHLDLARIGRNGHHTHEGRDQEHHISISPDSLLHHITGLRRGTVNSAHHQGVDMLAPRLRVTASADDGQAECLEWRQGQDAPFLLLVHWHPERLAGTDGLLSSAIASAFLEASRARRDA